MDRSYFPNPDSKENVSTYVCEECGEQFHSLNEYIAHYKHLHPRSIGTAIT
jgi:transposase-like protein